MSILLLYLAVGAVAGTIAGLFGVGGGLVIVPALVIAFTHQGLPVEVLTHMAVATSLATIVVTSISSIRTHQSKGAIDWGIFASLTPGIVIGVFFGVQTAALLAGQQLQLAIGCFVLLVSIQMGFGLQPGGHRQLPGRSGQVVAGGVIGWVSAIFGIGGGSLTVPYLSWCSVVMQRAVATSAACGLPIALAGALSNVYTGWSEEQLPQWSLGFVYLPALAGVVITSAPFARFGALLAHRLAPATLKKIFALFSFVVAIVMIGKGLGQW